MRYFFTYLTETERINSDIPASHLQASLYNIVLRKLQDSTVHNFRNTHETINFRSPVFRFVWNGFDLFNAVSAGEITFKIIGKSLYLKYKFFFWEFFVIAILFSIPAIFSLMPNTAFRVIYFLSVWIIYFISTVLAAHRFENYIKKLVKQIELSMVNG